HPTANARMNVRPRASSAYISIMNVSAAIPKAVTASTARSAPGACRQHGECCPDRTPDCTGETLVVLGVDRPKVEENPVVHHPPDDDRIGAPEGREQTLRHGARDGQRPRGQDLAGQGPAADRGFGSDGGEG